MIVLESDKPLGDEAHHYYDGLIDKLEADKKHIQHIQDLWGDPLTSSGSQSADNLATYVQVYLAGNQGETLANESVQAVRDIVAANPPPAGLKVYVTGAGPLSSDQQHAGDKSLQLITAVTIGVILIMLLLVYRSIGTVLLVLFMVIVELLVSRGAVAFLGHYEIIGLSTFAVNLLTLLAIAAGTDYAIFLVGRYHEARQAGEDRETAFYTMYHGTAHVILGSGLTVAGATFCLSFTRLPYFQTLGVPLAIGMLVVTLAALTMAPALMTVASRFGLLEPKRKTSTRGWRRIGTAVVRWPGPILVASLAVTLVGLACPAVVHHQLRRSRLSTCRRRGQRGLRRRRTPLLSGPAQSRIVVAASRSRSAQLRRTCSSSTGWPRSVFHLPGIARVQTITRPLGTPIEHTSIPYQISAQSINQQLNQSYSEDRTADLLLQAGDISDHDRHPPATDGAASRKALAPKKIRRKPSATSFRSSTICATRSPTSTTSSGPCATTSTGSRTASTSPSAPRCDRYSTRSTASDQLSDQFGSITASLDKIDRPAT